jgi:hypothetical protein
MVQLCHTKDFGSIKLFILFAIRVLAVLLPFQLLKNDMDLCSCYFQFLSALCTHVAAFWCSCLLIYSQCLPEIVTNARRTSNDERPKHRRAVHVPEQL